MSTEKLQIYKPFSDEISKEEYLQKCEMFPDEMTMKMLEIFLTDYTLKKEDVFFPSDSFRNFFQSTYTKLLNKESYEELDEYEKLNFEIIFVRFQSIKSLLLSSEYSSINLLKLLKD